MLSTFLLLQETTTQKPDIFLTYILPFITVCAVIANLIILIYLNSKSFKNEYYKKIIDKRLKVYEDLENLLSLISVYDVNNGKKYFVFLTDTNDYTKFVDQMNKVGFDSFYINKNTFRHFKSFNSYFIKNFSQIINNQTEMIEIAKSHYDSLSNLNFELRKLIYDDLRQLYKVKKFLKENIYYNKPLQRIE